MKLLYNGTKIYYAVYDRDLFLFTHSTTIPLSEFLIDEISDGNKIICADIYRNIRKVDINNLGKYYIENGKLYSRDGWEEYQEE
jgi:hypothetical protein